MNSIEAAKCLLNLIFRAQSLTEGARLEALLRLANANGLLVAVGDALEGEESLPEPYDQYYRQGKELAANSIAIFSELLTLCKSDGLPLLTIKSFLPFPYADSNIDIVAVNLEVVKKYQGLLHSLGFVRYRNLADIREPKKEMYIHRSDSKSDYVYPKMHLHRSISWNGVVYLEPAKVWSRHEYRSAGGAVFPIPSPEDASYFIGWFELIVINFRG